MVTPLLSTLGRLYGRRAPATLSGLYRRAGGPFSYLGRYWTTQRFDQVQLDTSEMYQPVRMLLAAGMVLQVLAGIALVYAGLFRNHAGALYVGIALLIGYPIIWAHVLFGLALIWNILHPKRYGKGLLASVLERQVRQLRSRNSFTLVAVAGSVGKTSTKLAISELLGTHKRVRYQVGNYNDRLTVPLVLFNATEPGIYNLPAWLRLIMHNAKKLRQPYPYDVAVVELGTDGPGQMAQFAYLQPDIGVLTAVAEEHMAYFKTLAAVGAEEATLLAFSAQALVNTDDVDKAYLGDKTYLSYGLKAADYSAKLNGAATLSGQKLTLDLAGESFAVKSAYLGAQGAKIVVAAAAVASLVGLKPEQIKTAIGDLKPFAGRMQLLPGIQKSTLLDDTYNASPVAVTAALDVLASLKAPQHIAILGDMNELGAISAQAHKAIGAYCDPAKLDLVVTIGSEARKHLAPAAQQAGCTVKSFASPTEAGDYVKTQLQEKAVVLAKGSQNGVFAEEALKPLLADQADAAKLVRQSKYWLQVKRSQFGR